MSERAPLVGITTYGPDGDAPEVHLPAAYPRAVQQAGGLPVLLGATGTDPDALLGALDALVIAGGGDISPEAYGGPGHATLYGVVPERDAFELALARCALARPELPVLGICRGMQILNVARGGDLEVHLPDVYGDAVAHRLPPRRPTLHPVALESDSVLHEIYGVTEFPGCSWHHQGLRTLGRGVRPVARAPDGVIEAVVIEDHPFALGVQWHPEMQVGDDPRQRRLFAALVERARRRA